MGAVHGRNEKTRTTSNLKIMGNYTYERFSNFVNRIIDLLSHVKRVDEETGEVFEESWDGEEIFFEEYGFNDVENAISVDYEYDDYEDGDDPDLDGCINDKGEVLADVHAFKLYGGELYIESTFYAGHGTSTTDWDRLLYGSLQRPIALEKAILGTMDKVLARRWRWDLGLYLDNTLYDIERGYSGKRTRSFSIPDGCIVPLGDGIPLLNGKVAMALRKTDSISIQTKPDGELLAIEDYAISPDDPSGTVSDFIEKMIGLLENQQSKWVVIAPDKGTDIGLLNLWCYGSKESGIRFDALIIKDKETVINDGDLDFIHLVFGSLHVPYGFVIPESSGIDPGVKVIEDSE